MSRLMVAAATALTILCALTSPARAADVKDIRAVVETVNEGVIVLDKGRNAGIEPRMVFDVYADAKVVRLPLGGTKNAEPIYIRQKVVGRLVIRSVTAGRARAEVTGKPERAPQAGDLALFNPTIRPENQPPVIGEISPKAESAFPWRKSVEISFEVENEPEDLVYFEWSCSPLRSEDKPEQKLAFEGGILESSRTTQPKNTWIVPPFEGRYLITIVARDTAGNETREQVVYVSEGVGRSELGSALPYQGVFTSPAWFRRVSDAFLTPERDTWVLERGSSSLVGGTASAIKVLAPDGALKEAVTIPEAHRGAIRFARSRDSLILLDAERKQVKVFKLAPRGDAGSTMRGSPKIIGGPGTGNGRFNEPVDLVLDSEGHIAVLDGSSATPSIHVFQEDGVFLHSLGMAGGGRGELRKPVGLASAPDGRLFCLDAGRKVVLTFQNGRFMTESAVSVGGPMTGIAYDPFEDILGIADAGSGRLQRVKSRTGELLRAVPGGRIQPAMKGLMRLKSCGAVRWDGARGFLVADREGASLARFDARNLKRYGFEGRLGGVELGEGLKVAADPAGHLVALNTSRKLVTRVLRSGWTDLQVGGENSFDFRFGSPVDVAVGHTGKIYVLDAASSRVYQFSREGDYVAPLGRPGDGPNQLKELIDLECSGHRDRLLILQERRDNNVFFMNENGSGSARPRGGISDPICATDGIGAESWIMNDTTLGRLPRGGAFGDFLSGFDEVTDMTTGVDGSVYIVDVDDGFIVVLDKLGRNKRKIELSQLSKPKDMGLDNYGRAYVYDDSSEQIHRLEPAR